MGIDAESRLYLFLIFFLALAMALLSLLLTLPPPPSGSSLKKEVVFKNLLLHVLSWENVFSWPDSPLQPFF